MEEGCRAILVLIRDSEWKKDSAESILVLIWSSGSKGKECRVDLGPDPGLWVEEKEYRVDPDAVQRGPGQPWMQL